jgi:tripeptidyl-peptidase-1
LYRWVNHVLAQPDLPQVISTSYGDDEQTVPFSYATAVCNGFAQLGARGISLFFGSGDSGVGTPGDCVANDGSNKSTFLATFPSTCPFITSVGATKLIPEVVAIDGSFASGGGFSRYFPRPKYQDNAVQKYVKGLDGEFSGLFNPAGRAYPDVAAQGFRYATIWDGELAILDGTSASTPTVASIMSLVNDALLTAGKPPMGFLNPWLYNGIPSSSPPSHSLCCCCYSSSRAQY